MGPSSSPRRKETSETAKKGKRDRFGARLTPSQKEILQRAANLTGRSLTEFVLNAAEAAAEETIRTYQVLELTARETEAFLAAIDNPPSLNRRLEEAIRDDGSPVRTAW